MALRAVAGVCLVTMCVFIAACSEPVNSIGVACPEGMVEWSSNGHPFSAAATREEALGSALRDIGMRASRETIGQGVIGSGPGPDPGKEEAVVETKSGVEVSMTLRPLSPGWVVESARWCAGEAS